MSQRIKPGLPKGTRDFLPEQMVRRQFVFDTVREIFIRYGFAPLETPSIEKLDVLSGKYGDEGENLIFKVLRRGTGLESLLKEATEYKVTAYAQLVEEALRYDLTVPLSRVIAMYQNQLPLPFKRYQIQPVWRADRPQKGRYREFYQCDIDTVGSSSMLADAESIAVVYEVLKSLGFTRFRIKINNRKILNGIIDYAGVTPGKAAKVLIAIDKLDKVGIDGVTAELQERGVTVQQSEALFSVLALNETPDTLLSELRTNFANNEAIVAGVEELAEIVRFLNDLGIPEQNYTVDLNLARGLGYYTGPIHESVLDEPGIGSLSGGGRYDKLIGRFLGQDIPACGMALGIERIIDVMGQLNIFPAEYRQTSDVLVTIFDAKTRTESVKYAQMLRSAGIATELYLDICKFKKQFGYADKMKIPFVIIIGPGEIAEDVITIKTMTTGDQISLDRAEGVDWLKKKIGLSV